MLTLSLTLFGLKTGSIAHHGMRGAPCARFLPCRPDCCGCECRVLERCTVEIHRSTRNRLLRSSLPYPKPWALPEPPPTANQTSRTLFSLNISSFVLLIRSKQERTVIPCCIKSCTHINVHTELKYVNTWSETRNSF